MNLEQIIRKIITYILVICITVANVDMESFAGESSTQEITWEFEDSQENCDNWSVGCFDWEKKGELLQQSDVKQLTKTTCKRQVLFHKFWQLFFHNYRHFIFHTF